MHKYDMFMKWSQHKAFLAGHKSGVYKGL